MINIAIVGYGYWGPNLVRNFAATENCNVKFVVDSRPERLTLAKKNYPAVGTSYDFTSVINDSGVDAVIIATPVFSHYKLAKQALLAGKHVLVEKPFTASAAESVELIDLARSKGKLLMVDHTFLYTGAVQKMKGLITNGDVGAVNYFDSTRINLGLFQPDVNVLWDLAPHDLSILLHLFNQKPVSVNARGVSHTGNEIENIAYMTLNFQSNIIAHFNCSWSSPVKLRTMLVGGDKKMIVYNDMEPTEKIKVYDTGVDVVSDEEKRKILVDYRVGDVYIPKLNTKEALLGMANDFIKCINENKTPVSSAELGLDVVRILEAAQTSIKQNGKEINLV
jgi:predicted dehydrogenase